ncbi:MAG: hypothetical protein IKN17_07270 [Ruminococcus sp.]|nr:hypothetical protein [Ruminococcus sp.]
MDQMITEKTFYKQLAGSAAGAITATCIVGGIVGFCAVFCGTQLGWDSILTIILLVVLGLCGALLLWFIIKTIRMKHHRVFSIYGNARELAAKINRGMLDPVYFARGFNANAPFTTLITEEFIVSGLELVSYMELNDLTTVHTGEFRPRHTIYVGNPVMTVGSVAANRIGDRYLESKGINDQTKFDILIFEDRNGKQHQYGVQHQDMENVLGMLQQIAPHIQFKP